MKGAIRDALETWLAGGGDRIGEVSIRRSSHGFILTHRDDAAPDRAERLERFTAPEDARLLAWLDDAGQYRPLKTEPNLRHGWVLELAGLDELCLALDFFYPAVLGVQLAFAEQRLAVVPLRETLNRQSGMYAVTRGVSDADAEKVIGVRCSCRRGCLKTILWELEPGHPLRNAEEVNEPPAEGAFPLLCNEACNLLVASIRKALKTP
jgi:sirohydrochlorin cobaltochelatase